MSMMRKRPVHLQTERFLLRNLAANDASERYLAWAADSDVMGPLNVKPIRMVSIGVGLGPLIGIQKGPL